MGDPEGSEGGARVYLQACRVALDCALCGNDLTLPPGFKVRALFCEGRGLVPGRANSHLGRPGSKEKLSVCFATSWSLLRTHTRL